MAGSTKCAAVSCKLAAHASCCWKMHVIEEGQRAYSGKTCGLRLCSVHVQTVNGKPLCMWHSSKASELGVT